jgi:hypothetical protein
MRRTPPPYHPESRPVRYHIILSRSRGLRALQKKFHRKVLITTVQVHQPPVSPEELVRTLWAKHCIRCPDVLVKVCAPPADFYVTFRSACDLNHVVESSVVVHCGGTPVSFARWGEDHGAKRRQALCASISSEAEL